MLELRHNVFDAHAGRVELDGVGGLDQGRDGARRVAFVAPLDLLAQCFASHRGAGGSQLGETAVDARIKAGREIELETCVRQHDGPDVAARHHHISAARELPLRADEALANVRHCRHCRDGARDLRRKQFDIEWNTVCKQAIAERIVRVRFDAQVERVGELCDRGDVICGNAASESDIRDCAVERAGIEKRAPKTRCEEPRDRALPGGDRTVDCDLSGCHSHKESFHPLAHRGPIARVAMFPWRATPVLPQNADPVAKRQITFYCGACGFESPKWIGRCPSCDAWNSFDEAPRSPKAASSRSSSARVLMKPLRLADVENTAALRLPTGIVDFDEVLGGGIVPGGVLLVAGPPGIGKSTLALAVASALAPTSRVLYACAEESAAQTKLRAKRLGASDEVLLAAGDDVEEIIAAARGVRPALLVVDSIQTVLLSGVDGAPGSVSQVRECAQALTRFGKETGCAVLLVGHVTKDGAIAGPKVLEHLVDVVLSFEGERLGAHRLLRATKNRFGATDGVCVFEMVERGLREVRDPSQVFLGDRHSAAAGTTVVATLAGARPLLAEIQALVSDAGYSSPRRLVSGLDYNRVCMVIAVLERRLGMRLSASDVYTSVVGGLRVVEPAADLGLAVAIVSALRDRAVARDLVCIGEIGLAGELRDVGGVARRIAEAAKLGFRRAIVPAAALPTDAPAALSVVPARTLADAISIAFGE